MGGITAWEGLERSPSPNSLQEPSVPPLDKWRSFQLCSNETQCLIQTKLESLPETRTIFLSFSKLGGVFQRPEVYLIVTAGEMTAA